MPMMTSDLSVAAIYTMYDSWFNETYNGYTGPNLERLSMRTDLGNNQGDRIDLNWLGAAPQLREWKDEKRPKGFNDFNKQLIVRDFEATVAINRNAIADGKWRQYEARIREMAQNARRHPWKLLSELIRDNGEAYDGQSFFDTDHSEGSSGTQSNIVEGNGVTVADIITDWFAVKKKMRTFKDDQGQVWGDIVPNLVVIPPDLEEVFTKVSKQLLIGNGETNVVAGQFEIEIDPDLTDTDDWYAFHTTRAMKPFIFLEREAPHPVNYVNPETSWAEFMRKEQYYSVEARREVGYGLWQYAVKVTN